MSASQQKGRVLPGCRGEVLCLLLRLLLLTQTWPPHAAARFLSCCITGSHYGWLVFLNNVTSDLASAHYFQSMNSSLHRSDTKGRILNSLKTARHFPKKPDTDHWPSAVHLANNDQAPASVWSSMSPGLTGRGMQSCSSQCARLLHPLGPSKQKQETSVPEYRNSPSWAH